MFIGLSVVGKIEADAAQNSVVHGNNEWARACGSGVASSWPALLGSAQNAATAKFFEAIFAMASVFMLMMFVWAGSSVLRRFRRRNYARLASEEARLETVSYGTQGEKAMAQYRD